MGYMHIDNLYKKNEFLELFNQVYVLEKIHGTSAHISLSPSGVSFFSGGASHDLFTSLFNSDCLYSKYKEFNNNTSYIIFGEAYGGKMQGMSHVYGEKLKFVVFDVQFYNDVDKKYWMSVPCAESFVKNFDLEFVWYTQCKNDQIGRAHV